MGEAYAPTYMCHATFLSYNQFNYKKISIFDKLV